jgi:ribonuclease G
MSSPRRRDRRLMISVGRDRRWAAWLEDERVIEFHHEREGEVSRVGNIYLGRITHVDKGLGAAFVDIGLTEAAFLPLSEAGVAVVEGARTIVQVEREGQAGKGPRVTTRTSLAGVRLILLPRRRGISISERIVDKDERLRLSTLATTLVEIGEGFTIRTAAIGAQEQQLREEAAGLRTSWQEMLDDERTRQPPAVLHQQPSIDLRLLRDHGLQFDEVLYDQRNAAAAAATWCRSALPELTARIAFCRDVEWIPTAAEILEQVEDALQSRVSLPTGGGIVIEPTEAMTVIDVNANAAGAQTDATNERALLRTNLAAADEVARQLRVRNIGGIVVIDFIDLKEDAHRRQVVDRLRTAVARDSAPVWVGAMSRLGLVELTRKRRGPTLSEAMTRVCAVCEGIGRVRRTSDET